MVELMGVNIKKMGAVGAAILTLVGVMGIGAQFQAHADQNKAVAELATQTAINLDKQQRVVQGLIDAALIQAAVEAAVMADRNARRDVDRAAAASAPTTPGPVE